MEEKHNSAPATAPNATEVLRRVGWSVCHQLHQIAIDHGGYRYE
jgi:hypothetical protein